LAELSRKVQEALEEGRILLLGTQVLLGFEFRAFFQPGFRELPEWAQRLKLVGLCVMLAAFALIVLPAAFHRLVEGGEDTRRQHRFTTRAVGLALLPLGAGLGLDVLVAVQDVLGARGAVVFGAAAFGTALAVWVGWTALARRRARGTRHADDGEEDEMAPSSLQNKIRHVLTEARMMLPGVQALLGFELAATLTEGFKELPRPAQLVHVAAIGGTVVAIVLLIAPAAYHRIVLEGEETEGFHRVATRLLVASLAPIAAALGAQLGVVTYVLTRAPRTAIATGLGATLLLLAAWYGLTLALRARRRSPAPGLRRAEARG
jgi:hypothetical protein